MDHPSLAITYALKEELKPFLKECQVRTRILEKPTVLSEVTFRGVPLILCQTGIGISNAHEGAEHLLKHFQPQLILSAGCAGAAHPELKTGDLVLANEIRSETPTDRFVTDVKTHEELENLIREEEIPHRTGPLMTVWKLAGTSAKVKAGTNGIFAIDMETAAIAAIAEKAKIPFASLRVIFDEATEALPFTEPYDENHPMSFLMKNPKAILSIPKFMKMNQVCQKNLCRVLGRFVDCYGK